MRKTHITLYNCNKPYFGVMLQLFWLDQYLYVMAEDIIKSLMNFLAKPCTGSCSTGCISWMFGWHSPTHYVYFSGNGEKKRMEEIELQEAVANLGYLSVLISLINL